MFDIISIGGITRDIFFEFESLKKNKIRGNSFLSIPYGSKIVADNTYYSYGGGAFNTATSFAKLGLRTSAFSCIGSEGTGSLAIERLRKNNVSTKFILRDKSLHTGLTVFIIGKDSEHTGFLERGANDHLKISRWSSLKKSKWFYISSLTGSSSKLLPDLFNHAVKNGIRVAFNPGSVQLNSGYRGLKDCLQKTEVLILNNQEAENLVESKIKKPPKDSKSILVELKKMGPSLVVVTNSEKGSVAYDGNKFYSALAYSVDVIDTTGAGDAFGSTFVYGFMRKFDIGYCLKISAINAASVVSKMGATEGLLTYNSIRSSKWL